MKVSVIGLGKAGLPLAAVIADSGIHVYGVDIDQGLIDKINSGKNPIPQEPELDKLIPKHSQKNLTASDKYQKSDAFIVIAPLFIDEEKKPDFSVLDEIFEKISGVLEDENLVVLETTVPPQTTETRFKKILDRSDKRYHLAYSPERIMTGRSVDRYRNFPKVVGGIDKGSGNKAFELYKTFCGKVHLVSDIRTAEMIKVSEGVYRDVNIALSNELFRICEEKDIDYFEVRRYANHDYCHLHKPGNVGGHCIPVYPWFLINYHDTRIIKTARDINDNMIKYYAAKIKGKKVLVMGLTYRDGVKELAYSKSIDMVNYLKEKGFKTYVYDPLYNPAELKGYDFSDEFESMDTIILMNRCKETHDRIKKIKEKVIDVHGVLD